MERLHIFLSMFDWVTIAETRKRHKSYKSRSSKLLLFIRPIHSSIDLTIFYRLLCWVINITVVCPHRLTPQALSRHVTWTPARDVIEWSECDHVDGQYYLFADVICGLFAISLACHVQIYLLVQVAVSKFALEIILANTYFHMFQLSYYYLEQLLVLHKILYLFLFGEGDILECFIIKILYNCVEWNWWFYFVPKRT